MFRHLVFRHIHFNQIGLVKARISIRSNSESKIQAYKLNNKKREVKLCKLLQIYMYFVHYIEVLNAANRT